MNDITETVEEISVAITSEPSAVKGLRHVQIKCTGALNSYRQQFDIAESETKIIRIPFTLVDGRLEVGYNGDLCPEVREAIFRGDLR